MKIVVQRVKSSHVKVEGKVVGSIDKGLNLLVCMEQGDDEQKVKLACEKIPKLRIFSDENGRMNKSITDIDGKLLCISQFTLSWNGKKGNRPSFDQSMSPEDARILFEKFCSQLRDKLGAEKVETGVFAASMEVAIVNDGPVTFSFEY